MTAPSPTFLRDLNAYLHSPEHRYQTFLVKITDSISEEMKKQEVSGTELARRIGKKDSTVSRILSGESNFTLKSLFLCIDALDCELSSALSRRIYSSDFYREVSAPRQLSLSVGEIQTPTTSRKIKQKMTCTLQSDESYNQLAA